LNDLGEAKKIVVEKEKQHDYRRQGQELEIKARIRTDQHADRGSHQRLRQREAARTRCQLSGGVAVIKVRRGTEIRNEGKEGPRRDALHATRAAVEEAWFGGGVCAHPRTESCREVGPARTKINSRHRILSRAIEERSVRFSPTLVKDPAVSSSRK